MTLKITGGYEYDPHREKWCDACLKEDFKNCTMPHGDLGLVCEDYWFTHHPISPSKVIEVKDE